MNSQNTFSYTLLSKETWLRAKQGCKQRGVGHLGGAVFFNVLYSLYLSLEGRLPRIWETEKLISDFSST